MGIRDWFTRRRESGNDPRLRHWRATWLRLAAAPDDDQIRQLADELEGFGLTDDEVEIEREMLQALIDRQVLASGIRTSGLPRVETGHRVVRGEPCHYSEPASMPDEPGQPVGRLLLTANRAIFVGSGKTVTAAWHAMPSALHIDRDVVLVRNGQEQTYRFRCNTYGDALRAAYIAGQILGRRH